MTYIIVFMTTPNKKEAEKIKINEQEKTKKEIVGNSIFLAEKLLKEKVDDKKNKELINDYLKNLKWI